ncbi:MAG: helix-turn-helix domain-containing GNAT family N-acetyltransferase [Pseudomonadota bacterium]
MDKQVAEIRAHSRAMVRELDVLDSQHCFGRYSLSECHLLTELESMGEASAGELSERLVLEKSTISRMVQRLIDHGEILMRSDQSDRRKKRLRLSAAGRKATAALHAHSNHRVGEALSFLPDSDRALIIGGLSAYAKALRYARVASDYTIRPITRRDNPSVAAIIRDVMTEHGAVGSGFSINDPEVDDMFGAYHDDRAAFFVIEHDGELLGCGGIAPLIDGDEDTCELRKMYFLSDLRGKGLGARLLGHALNAARDAGFKRCYLETLDSMGQARRLYSKFGFTPISGPMGNTGHSGCDSYMVRDL